MASEKLLPCPFCAGERVTDRHVRDGRQMFCQTCGASVAPSYHGPNNDTLERARAAWNTRSSFDPHEEYEHFLAVAIDRSPEPLRQLGEYLSEVLDEDQFPRADRLLLGIADAVKTAETSPVAWRVLADPDLPVHFALTKADADHLVNNLLTYRKGCTGARAEPLFAKATS